MMKNREKDQKVEREVAAFLDERINSWCKEIKHQIDRYKPIVVEYEYMDKEIP